MVYHRGKYGAFKVSSILHCPKTMKNSCILTLLVDSFRQFDQNQSVVNYFLLFEVHITLGFKSEVTTFINTFCWEKTEKRIATGGDRRIAYCWIHHWFTLRNEKVKLICKKLSKSWENCWKSRKTKKIPSHMRNHPKRNKKQKQRFNEFWSFLFLCG